MGKIAQHLFQKIRGEIPVEREMTSTEVNTERREYQVQKAVEKSERITDRWSQYQRKMKDIEQGY